MKFIDPQNDRWQAAVDEDGPTPTPESGMDRLLTLEQWHAVREQWPQTMRAGVVVPNDVDIESLEADLPRLALIALQFPKWVDGRAYSQARLLRSRLRYRGEVRATGDVGIDQLVLMERTGFSSAVLKEGKDPADAPRQFSRYADGFYQGDVHETQPLFARRAAA